MGNCIGKMDVSTRYKAGADATAIGTQPEVRQREAQQAVALLTGSLAYSSQVDIRVSCTNLKDADLLSKSDPMVVLYEVTPAGRREVGRTECIANAPSPSFVTPFRVLYNFEKVQEYHIVAVDLDKGQPPETVNIQDCTKLGELSFKLAELMGSRTRELTRTVAVRGPGNHPTTMTVYGEELSSAREVLNIVLGARSLRNVEFLSKSDPFLRISRLQEDGLTWLPVYKTETRRNNLNPQWDPIVIRAAQLNNGDTHRPLKLQVYDYEANGRHRLLGTAEANVPQLQAMVAAQKELPLKPSGSLLCAQVLVEQQPSFLDYIKSGTEISFVVAVDFTGSNGAPADPSSLHYLNPAGYTPYEEAVVGVGHVLEFYDSDRQYPCFGFGGQQMPYPVNHCFPLSDAFRGTCDGVQGILNNYRASLYRWQLSGPTLFTPVIRMATSIAREDSGTLRYTVLLILTDGVIMDMDQTIDAIIDASYQPMSILVVGIGNADFAAMRELDADESPLASRTTPGRVAVRDIVQFVKFNDFKSDGKALAAELLAELPGQFLQYVRTKKIPLPDARNRSLGPQSVAATGTPVGPRLSAIPPHLQASGGASSVAQGSPAPSPQYLSPAASYQGQGFAVPPAGQPPGQAPPPQQEQQQQQQQAVNGHPYGHGPPPPYGQQQPPPFYAQQQQGPGQQGGMVVSSGASTPFGATPLPTPYGLTPAQSSTGPVVPGGTSGSSTILMPPQQQQQQQAAPGPYSYPAQQGQYVQGQYGVPPPQPQQQQQPGQYGQYGVPPPPHQQQQQGQYGQYNVPPPLQQQQQGQYGRQSNPYPPSGMASPTYGSATGPNPFATAGAPYYQQHNVHPPAG